jgi:Na+/H+-translocating membrane pyrophosphatase
MGYYDGLVDVNFKRLEDDKIVFYPHGILDSGYILNDEQTQNAKSYLKKYYKLLSFIIPIIAVLILAFKISIIYAIPITICGIITAMGIYYSQIRRFLRSAERTQEKQGLKERVQIMATSMGMGGTIMLLIGNLVLTAVSLFMFFHPSLQEKIIGAASSIFFGVGLILSTYELLYLIRLIRKR